MVFIGVSEPEVDRFGKWGTEGDRDKEKGGTSKVCRKYYIGNVSLTAVLALAGHKDSFGKFLYSLDRGRAYDISSFDKLREDEPVQAILEHLFPGLLDAAIRARDALESRPHEDTDPISITNANVTRCLVMCCAAWIQDSIILLRRYPSLRNLEPYASLFDPVIAQKYETIVARVDLVIRERDMIDVTMIQQTRELGREMNRFHTKTMDELQMMKAGMRTEISSLKVRGYMKRRLWLTHLVM